jgi:hypothetical protein
VLQHWLLIRGAAGRLLPERVDPAALRTHASTRRPTIQKGDAAICYASGWQSIFAVVEIVGDPENDPDRDRWQWRIPIQPVLVLPDLGAAPPVEAASVFPRSLGRHSYIRLSPAQFDAARAAIAAVTQSLQEPYARGVSSAPCVGGSRSWRSGWSQP